MCSEIEKIVIWIYDNGYCRKRLWEDITASEKISLDFIAKYPFFPWGHQQIAKRGNIELIKYLNLDLKDEHTMALLAHNDSIRAKDLIELCPKYILSHKDLSVELIRLELSQLNQRDLMVALKDIYQYNSNPELILSEFPSNITYHIMSNPYAPESLIQKMVDEQQVSSAIAVCNVGPDFIRRNVSMCHEWLYDYICPRDTAIAILQTGKPTRRILKNNNLRLLDIITYATNNLLEGILQNQNITIEFIMMNDKIFIVDIPYYNHLFLVIPIDLIHTYRKTLSKITSYFHIEITSLEQFIKYADIVLHRRYRIIL